VPVPVPVPPEVVPLPVPVPPLLLLPFPQPPFNWQFAFAASVGLIADPPHAVADNISAVRRAIQARRSPRFVLAMG